MGFLVVWFLSGCGLLVALLMVWVVSVAIVTTIVSVWRYCRATPDEWLPFDAGDGDGDGDGGGYGGGDGGGDGDRRRG